METTKTFWLTNGLVVRIEDNSLRDSPTSCKVRLVIKCTIVVRTEYIADFTDSPYHLEIMKLLLPETEYRREIVQARVDQGHAESEKVKLIEAFEKNALPYFQVEDFPARYVRKLYRQLEKELSAGGS